MKLSVYHATTYRYDEPVSRSTQYIRLTPVTNHRQRVLEWQLDLPNRSIELLDAFGNLTNLMTLSRPHDSISSAPAPWRFPTSTTASRRTSCILAYFSGPPS